MDKGLCGGVNAPGYMTEMCKKPINKIISAFPNGRTSVRAKGDGGLPAAPSGQGRDTNNQNMKQNAPRHNKQKWKKYKRFFIHYSEGYKRDGEIFVNKCVNSG